MKVRSSNSSIDFLQLTIRATRILIWPQRRPILESCPVTSRKRSAQSSSSIATLKDTWVPCQSNVCDITTDKCRFGKLPLAPAGVRLFLKSFPVLYGLIFFNDYINCIFYHWWICSNFNNFINTFLLVFLQLALYLRMLIVSSSE